jgi:hypothetical protein
MKNSIDPLHDLLHRASHGYISHRHKLVRFLNDIIYKKRDQFSGNDKDIII